MPLSEILSKIDKPNEWFSLMVRDEFPNLDRLWLKNGENRICLHKLYPIPDGKKPFFHRHQWACETRIVVGSYWMNVGYGPGPEEPPVAARLRLTAGGVFIMDKPESWHTVEPEEVTYTIFRITTKWGKAEGTCHTRHHRLSQTAKVKLLQEFGIALKMNQYLIDQQLQS